MRKMLHVFKSIIMLFVCMSVNTGLGTAQVSVPPGFNTIDSVLTANPSATVLVLKRGQIYYQDADIKINTPVTIMGESTPANLPPPVFSYVETPGANLSAQALITIGANTTLKNLGLMSFTYDDQQLFFVLNVTAPDISITIDSCIVQGAHHFMNLNSLNGLNILEKNSKFFNFSVIGWDNYGGYNALVGGDNVNFETHNNTFFVCGRVLGGSISGPNSTEVHNHNSYVNVWGDCFYPTNANKFVVENNIFFNPHMRGYVGKRTTGIYAGWPTDFNGDFPSSAARDSLQGDVAILLNGGALDAPRDIEIKNNLRFSEAKVLAQIASNSGTPMPFINDSVKGTFNTFTSWVYEEPINIDPQFAMGAFPDSVYTYAFLEAHERRMPAANQSPGFPFQVAWYPNGAPKGQFIWPLPFNLKPTSASMVNGNDGYPLGDLNWYGHSMLADWEAGKPNGIAKRGIEGLNLTCYPNPASSSAIISYNLASEDIVSLKVYNLTGQEVANLVNATQAVGIHNVPLNTTNLSNGLYFYRIQIGETSVTQKMMIVK